MDAMNPSAHSDEDRELAALAVASFRAGGDGSQSRRSAAQTWRLAFDPRRGAGAIKMGRPWTLSPAGIKVDQA
jgi:hypothetical protein